MTYLTESGRKSLGLMGSIGRVVAGDGRETIPDFQIIGPLVNGVRAVAVDKRIEDAVDGRVVDAHVRPAMIGDHLAIDGHPHPPIGAAAAMPEYLEFEPLVHGHRDGIVVRLNLPKERAQRLNTTTAVSPRSHVNAHAVITGGLPLEEGSPGLGGHLRQQIRLVLEPVGYVEVALFAGRLEQENVLGRIVSPLRDFAVKRLGLIPSMPGHGLDSIGHVIADARAADDLAWDELETKVTAPDIAGPGERRRTVHTTDRLPAVNRRIQDSGAAKAGSKQQIGLRGGDGYWHQRCDLHLVHSKLRGERLECSLVYEAAVLQAHHAGGERSEI